MRRLASPDGHVYGRSLTEDALPPACLHCLSRVTLWQLQWRLETLPPPGCKPVSGGHSILHIPASADEKEQACALKRAACAC